MPRTSAVLLLSPTPPEVLPVRSEPSWLLQLPGRFLVAELLILWFPLEVQELDPGLLRVSAVASAARCPLSLSLFLLVKPEKKRPFARSAPAGTHRPPPEAGGLTRRRDSGRWAAAPALGRNIREENLTFPQTFRCQSAWHRCGTGVAPGRRPSTMVRLKMGVMECSSRSSAPSAPGGQPTGSGWKSHVPKTQERT